jgi:hypothetical protein
MSTVLQSGQANVDSSKKQKTILSALLNHPLSEVALLSRSARILSFLALHGKEGPFGVVSAEDHILLRLIAHLEALLADVDEAFPQFSKRYPTTCTTEFLLVI